MKVLVFLQDRINTFYFRLRKGFRKGFLRRKDLGVEPLRYPIVSFRMSLMYLHKTLCCIYDLKRRDELLV